MGVERVPLLYECYVKEGKDIWFFGIDHNGLYHMDVERNEVKFLGKVPDEKEYQQRLYASMIIVKNSLYLIPFNAENIAVYNIKTGVFDKIEIKNFEKEGEKRSAKFWKTAAVYGSKIIIMPHFYQAMIILDTDTGKVKYITDFLSALESQRINKQPYIGEIILEENIVYGSCCCLNAIIKFNMSNYQFSIIEIPYEGSGYHGIFKIGQTIWLTPRMEGGIVCYDLNSGMVEEYSDFPKGYEAVFVPFHSFFKYKVDSLLLPPARANMFILLNIKDGTMKNFEELTKIISQKKPTYGNQRDVVTSVNSSDGMIQFVSGLERDFCIYDIDGQKLTKIKLYTDHKEYPNDNYLRVIQYPRLMKSEEMDIINLEDYIEGVCQELWKRNGLEIEQKTVGESIYEIDRI